jgi:hypothetical protein
MRVVFFTRVMTNCGLAFVSSEVHDFRVQHAPTIPEKPGIIAIPGLRRDRRQHK